MWKRRSHVADAARGTARTSAIVTSMTIWTSSSKSRPAANEAQREHHGPIRDPWVELGA